MAMAKIFKKDVLTVKDIIREVFSISWLQKDLREVRETYEGTEFIYRSGRIRIEETTLGLALEMWYDENRKRYARREVGLNISEAVMFLKQAADGYVGE